MSHRLEGEKFWKVGEHGHVWAVDAVIEGGPGQRSFAILVSEDERTAEEVDLSHLEDRNLYTPIPPGDQSHS